MSLAPGDGWWADFKGGYSREVVVWQQQADVYVVGMVVDEQNGKLRAAESYSTFNGYRRSATHLRQIILARGIKAVYRTSDGSTRSDPVDVIGLTDDGDLRLLNFDQDGNHEDVTRPSGFIRLDYTDNPDEGQEADPER